MLSIVSLLALSSKDQVYVWGMGVCLPATGWIEVKL